MTDLYLHILVNLLSIIFVLGVLFFIYKKRYKSKLEIQKALQESEQLNRAIIENFPIGISVRNKFGKLLHYNDSWLKIWGMTEDELQEDLKRERSKLSFDEKDNYLKKWKEKVLEVYKRGKELSIPEIEITKPAVAGKKISNYFYALKDSMGDVDKVVILTEDITDKKIFEKNLQRFSMVVEQSFDGIAIVDLKGNIDYINPAWGTMHQCTLEEALGNDIRLFFAEDFNLSIDRFFKVLTDSSDQQLYTRQLKRDGSIFPSLLSISILQDENEKPIGFVLISKDMSITESYQRELRISEQRLRAMLESTTDFILLSDKNAKPIYYNSAYADVMKQLLGIEMEPGLQPHTLLPDHRERELWESYHERVLGGESFMVEFSFPDPSGEMRYFEHSFNPIYSDQEIIGFSEFTHEITDSRNLLEQIKASENKFRELTEHLYTSIFIYDLDGKFIYVNPMASELTGYNESELLEMHYYDLIPDNLKDAIIKRGKAQLSGSVPRDSDEVPIITKEGAYHWIFWSTVAIEHEGARAVLGTAVDIEEKKQQELALKHIEEERYLQAKEIAGSIAHEIGNAIFPGSSYLQLIKKKIYDQEFSNIEDLNELITKTEQTIERAYAITKTVKDYTRLDLQKDVKKIDLKKAIDDVLHENYKIVKYSIGFNIEGLNYPIVEMDNSHLYSLLYNIIDNAADAMIESSRRLIDISISQEEDQYVVSIKDTGVGIAREELPKIFEPFFTQKAKTGTGLGLSISKHIVEMYYGTIDISSVEGEGTTIRFTLPVGTE